MKKIKLNDTPYIFISRHVKQYMINKSGVVMLQGGNIEEYGLFSRPLYLSYDSMDMEILISKQNYYV